MCLKQLDPTIHRSIAKIQPFQVDQDGKSVPENDTKHVKMMRSFFSADLNIFLTFSSFKQPRGTGFVCHADPTIHRSIAKIPPFQVDPDGKSVPENDTKHVKMMRPFLC